MVGPPQCRPPMNHAKRVSGILKMPKAKEICQSSASVYDHVVNNITRAYQADGKPVKAHAFRGKRPHELKGVA
jgi:hypothetical protein